MAILTWFTHLRSWLQLALAGIAWGFAAENHLNDQVKELLADENPPVVEDHDMPF
jgi:hypothetical protein